jgi:hypothetical protein
MNLKYIFTIVVLLWLATANSQTKTQFNTFRDGNESVRFTTDKIDFTKIMSLDMLSRVEVSRTWNEDFNVMNSIKNFNWATDAYRNESYKRMFYNLYKHDRYGREFLSNINEGIINQIYLKNATFDY